MNQRVFALRRRLVLLYAFLLTKQWTADTGDGRLGTVTSFYGRGWLQRWCFCHIFLAALWTTTEENGKVDLLAVR